MTKSLHLENIASGDRLWAASDAGEAAPFGAKRHWRRHGPAVAIAGLCLIAGDAFIPQPYTVHIVSPANAAGADKQPSEAPPVPSAKPEGEAGPINVNLFLEHASGAGINTCAGVYGSLGKALANGNPFMLQTQSAKENADVHSLQGIVGMNYRSETGYVGPAAGLVFAAPVGTSCEGQMVRVVPVPEICEATAALLPKGTTPRSPLNGIPVYSLPGGGQAMLVPANPGCVAISIVWSGR